MSIEIRQSLRIRMHSALRGVFTAIFDQALVSGVNFATVLMVGREVSKSDFGAYALIMAVGLLLANTQSALIAQPLSAVGVRRSGDEFSAYVAATARLQLIATAASSSIVLGVALYADAIWNTRFTHLLILAVPFYVFWQLQELARRVLYAQERNRAVVCNDVVAYGGQLMIVAILFALNEITVPVLLAVAAITSALGCALAVIQIPALRASPLQLAVIWRENWKYGRWIALADSLQAASSRLYIYATAILLTTAATGTLQAVAQIANVSNVFMFALMSTLMPRFGRTLAMHGVNRLRRVTFQWMFAALFVAGLVLVIPFWLSESTLNLLYGGRYDGVGGLLRIQVVVMLVWIPTYLLTLGIRILQANWIFPIVQAFNIVLALSLGIYLLTRHGLEGSLVASGIAAATNLAILTWTFLRVCRTVRRGEVAIA